MVEFALVFPLFLVLFCSILEYGWIMCGWIVLTNAAAQGARAVILNQDATVTVKNNLWQTMCDENPAGELKILVEDLEKGAPESGNPKRCKVIVSWNVERLIRFLPSNMVPATLKAESVMAYIE